MFIHFVFNVSFAAVWLTWRRSTDHTLQQTRLDTMKYFFVVDNGVVNSIIRLVHIQPDPILLMDSSHVR